MVVLLVVIAWPRCAAASSALASARALKMRRRMRSKLGSSAGVVVLLGSRQALMHRDSSAMAASVGVGKGCCCGCGDLYSFRQMGHDGFLPCFHHCWRQLE